MKYFIITIDTEGDNLWEYKLGDAVQTKNAKYIPRFQELCDKFHFKPVYLTNYEMAKDDFFVEFAKSKAQKNNCEIGLHLHAWNNPPYFELKNPWFNYGMPYLIEYPKQAMREKFSVMYNLFCEKFETRPVSHRAGRWAMNQDYFDLLIEYGLKADCSVTPHISWESSKGYSMGSVGSDYRNHSEKPIIVKQSTQNGSILEIPLTVKKMHRLSYRENSPLWKKPLQAAKNLFLGKSIRFCPASQNMPDMLELINRIKNSNDKYLMFMMHSSEFMPGGSPSFRTNEAIEQLYRNLEILFENVSQAGFKPVTFKEAVEQGVFL